MSLAKLWPKVLTKLLLILVVILWLPASNAGESRIAAATSLIYALEEISELFQKQTGHMLKLSFASSGTLTRQIQAGAPFGIFLSADAVFIEALHQQGLTQNTGKIYARGKLVLFTAKGSPLPLSTDLSSLLNYPSGKKQRFAIANPELAPYGKIARQALQSAGCWERLYPYLITGENASQTARFALSKSVDGALLPLSLALILKQQGRGDFILISEDLYQPLEQRMVLLKPDEAATQGFYEFLQQESAQAVFTRHGFTQ